MSKYFLVFIFLSTPDNSRFLWRLKIQMPEHGVNSRESSAIARVPLQKREYKSAIRISTTSEARDRSSAALWPRWTSIVCLIRMDVPAASIFKPGHENESQRDRFNKDEAQSKFPYWDWIDNEIARGTYSAQRLTTLFRKMNGEIYSRGIVRRRKNYSSRSASRVRRIMNRNLTGRQSSKLRLLKSVATIFTPIHMLQRRLRGRSETTARLEHCIVAVHDESALSISLLK